MGCNCSKGASKASQEIPPINMQKITDPFVKFEKSFPFYRMHIENYNKQIYSFGKDTVKIEELKNRFDGAIWRDQFDEGSELNQLLRELPGSSDDEVSTSSLLMLGVIWCGGDFADKGNAMFQLLNPPGQNQDSISAGDKDWKDVFDTMVYMASYLTYTLSKKKYGDSVISNYQAITGQSELYTEEHARCIIAAMRTCELDEPQGFIQLVFGYESKLSKE